MDFGDGTTSKDINPIKTYVNGTYKVVLEIEFCRSFRYL
jgi:PKD repeat protein